MSSDRWLPRSQRDTDGSDYYRLRDGVPDGLRPSLLRWLGSLLDYQNQFNRDLSDDDAIFSGLERRLDRPLADYDALKVECLRDPDYFLDVIDVLLNSWAGESACQQLEAMMKESRTLWRPVKTPAAWCLERHVSQELDATLDKTTGRPHDYLKGAWRKQFGRSPQPDGAYHDAIRAIEAAIIPAMGLTVKDPTLGKALGQLKNNPGGYDVGFAPSRDFVGVTAVWYSLMLLWKSQFDRHGTPDDDVPLNVSPEESERAVVLATAYVFGLQNGLLRRKPG